MTAPDPQSKHTDPATILEARAEALARKTLSPREEGRSLDVVEFMLANETYAIELAFIREVYPLRGMTYLPGTPAFVSGIINLRGEIVSVVDLKKFFDLPEAESGQGHHVIILSSDEMEFGILADCILGQTRIFASAIQKTLPTLTGIREKYLKGVANGATAILDGGRLLSDKDLYIYQETGR